nr:6-bladed beta-propeller [uncultured Phocaeicola sp.]
MSLSELVSDWRLIKLENTSKEMMVSTVCRIYLSENYLIVSNIDNNVLLFNGEGKFQRKVGRVGNGPADILPGVITVQIDEKREKIYLTDSQMRKMKMYCLSDASYIGAIPLSFQAITPSYMVNSQDSTILITHVPMNDSPAVLWKQDFQGNVLSSIVPKRFENPKGFWMLGTDAFYMWKNKDKITLAILHNPATNDSLYHYNESTNEVHPYFAVNFPGDAPDHWIYETSDFYMITINGSTGGDISSGYHNGPQQRIIIDKKTGRGAYANIVLDGYGNIPITKQRFYMWGEYFTLTLSPEWVAEMAEKALAHPEYLKPGEKERLQTLVDSITEEDNIFIVYGKIK